MNIKKTIAGLSIAGALGGWFSVDYALDKAKIDAFRDDLILHKIEKTKATNISEYFHGKKDNLNPTKGGEKDEWFRVCNKVIAEVGITDWGAITPEAFVAKCNNLINLKAEAIRIDIAIAEVGKIK